jgi:alpha-ketoglutarate-dependent taurine dioxygenase
METIDLNPRIGTEIIAPRAELLAGTHAETFRRLLEERGVLVFRQTHFDGKEQEQFAATFGEVIQERAGAVTKVSLDKRETSTADYLRGAFFWHIDGANDAVPTWATFLTAKVLSETGGDTEFANTYAAYDDLPAEKKAEIEGLKAWHSLEYSQRVVYPDPSYETLMQWQKRKPKLHPLVWTHKSGRKSLVIGATTGHIEGMSLEDGRALLTWLKEWATQPQFVLTYTWQVGDMVVWDNTGTMHRATLYDLDSGRMMHRSTLVGQEALA